MTSSTRVFNTELIFSVALNAAKSIAAPPREGGKKEALVSVIFAAVSLQAFLNELIESAQDFSNYADEPVIVSSFADLMSDLEKNRDSVETRFNMAHWMLSGRGFDKSAPPYQDFRLLFQVRNDMVHFKPDPLKEEGIAEPIVKVIERLRGKNILNDSPAPDSSRSWVHTIGTRSVAEWACNTTSLVTADIVSKLPASRWRSETEELTRAIRTVHFREGRGR